MRKRFLLATVGILFIQSLFAQIPAGYYDSATGTGYTLKTQLYNIIKDHTSVSYTPGVWDAFYTTDKKANGYVWDMYSDVPEGSPAYDYTFGTDQCGNYSGEGSCYNREHSFPKSWFNDASPMTTDLFHLYPTDGYVNGKRSNYPFGEVGSASWTSTNGSKLGTCDYPGYSGTVFEPINEYKGDFARTYFYMATRYENVISSWPGSDMLDGSSDQCFSDWALEMLIQWHNNDPVSQKETDRNDAVYAIQDNRNPFIDHPEYVSKIWGGEVLNNPPFITDIVNSPVNPTSGDAVTVTATITDSDGIITNAELHWGLSSGNLVNIISMSVSSGDTYSSDSDIPAQTDGTTVYYEIQATDDSSDLTTSSENTYTINDNPSITILSEDFINCPASGWTTYSVAGSEDWGCGANGMQVNAYNSDVACDDWFISPAIDLNSYSNEILTFTSWTRYTDTYHPPIELKYSTNYSGSGDPSSASWTDLTATWSAQDSQTWTNSGDIDLSSITGSQVYIAFHYTSSGTGSGTSAWWEIDDVLIIGNASSSNIVPEISGISIDPTSPTENDNVTISATITDSDGTIISANIKWGTSTGNYPNTVSMSNSGDDYSGIIPAQANETEVFFVIEAEDNESGTTLSSELNYIVEGYDNQAPVISDVILEPSNPTEDENPIVSCIANDTDGAVVLVVLKWKRGTGDYTDVNMNFSGGRYYGQIPKQAVGETVYFLIIAEDNEGLQSNYEGSYEISESNSINDLENKNLKIYPNPTRNNINIEFTEQGFINSIKVYNIIGKKMLEMSNLNIAKYTIELSRFPKGMYIIQVNDSENNIVRKVMLK